MRKEDEEEDNAVPRRPEKVLAGTWVGAQRSRACTACAFANEAETTTCEACRAAREDKAADRGQVEVVTYTAEGERRTAEKNEENNREETNDEDKMHSGDRALRHS